MNPTIKDITRLLEQDTPLTYAEDFDNVGLLVGNPNTPVSKVLITLDTTLDVLEEAIQTGCNLVISFHPIIFSGLKKITGRNYVERIVMKAIENKIAIYAPHTALDNQWEGVNGKICDLLNLNDRQILLPKKETLLKLSTYIPSDHLETVKEALFAAGAGHIGNYSSCSFSFQGTGTFKGSNNSTPAIGKPNVLENILEHNLQVIVPKHAKNNVIAALNKSHPYEEVAFDLFKIENSNHRIGLGMVGSLESPIKESEALELLKNIFNTSIIRHSGFLGKSVQRIAVLGGSGAFAINAAKTAGADLFVTSDLKYHDFFKAEKTIVLADIGHYESEKFTKNRIKTLLYRKIHIFASKFNPFDVILSKVNTNPVEYFI